MALIECSECGNKVSDKASACPHCGAPVIVMPHGKLYDALAQCRKDELKDRPERYRRKKSNSGIIYFVLFICIVMASPFVIANYLFNREVEHEKNKELAKEINAEKERLRIKTVLDELKLDIERIDRRVKYYIDGEYIFSIDAKKHQAFTYPDNWFVLVPELQDAFGLNIAKYCAYHSGDGDIRVEIINSRNNDIIAIRSKHSYLSWE